MLRSLTKEDRIFIPVLLIALAIYTINLGVMPLLADEPTRAVVSLEMVLSGNYIVPSIASEAYLNKPPLFNWIVAFFMHAAGNFSEGDLRIISLSGFFAITILHYVIASKYVSKQNALWSSLAFLTCGRIIFYDSMMGYIDPIFSFIVLLNFYWILIQSNQSSNAKTFLISYLLCFIAFFLKGLPACTFQLFTLVAAFGYRNKFKSLFSLAHLCGISLFVLCLSVYYYEYGAYASIQPLLNAVVEQSTQRTPLSTKIGETCLHIIQFPFQFLIDFMPFSLLLFFCFRKNILSILKENDFVFTALIIFSANIWLYWLSAETRARYLFMFLPLFFTIVFYAYEKFKSEFLEKGIRITTYLMLFVLIIILAVTPFLRRFNFIEDITFISCASIIVCAAISYILFKRKISALTGVVFMLLLLRLDFNLLILPLRKKESPESIYKLTGKNIALQTKGKKLYLLQGAPINHDILYYATKDRKAIISTVKAPVVDENAYYICTREQMQFFSLNSVEAFDVSYQDMQLFLAEK